MQQTFNDECRAYLEEGGILKVKLPEKNKTSNRKIELKEEATIIRKEGKFGLRWENNGKEFFDNEANQNMPWTSTSRPDVKHQQ